MIGDFANHAANERTFLAWVRTGIAIIALGFVIEKFNLFLLTIAKTLDLDALHPAQMQKLSGPLGRNSGLALVLGGVLLICLAILRFLRTERLLAAAVETPSDGVARSEFFLLVATVLFVAAFSAYIALG